MTQENFEKAKAITNNIAEYKEHLRRFKVLEECYSSLSLRNQYGDRVDLNCELLPIKYDSFIKLYVEGVESKIKELEAEFESL